MGARTHDPVTRGFTPEQSYLRRHMLSDFATVCGVMAEGSGLNAVTRRKSRRQGTLHSDAGSAGLAL